MNRYEQHKFSGIEENRSPQRRAAFFEVVLGRERQDSKFSPRGVGGRLAERAALKRQIEEIAENGHVAVVTSGMDCDGSAWRDRVTLLPAHPALIARWERDYYAGAEGPQGHYFERPSVAAGLKTESRDLALEAFENGHPHRIAVG